jgi:hypothetical protein
MIYAVEILDRKFVKIGFSANEDVAMRIASLQTGCPFEIKPILTTFGSLLQEQALHASLLVAFNRIRVPVPPNEWYPGLHPFMKEFVEYLRYGPDAALALAEHKNPAVRQFSTKTKRGSYEKCDIMRWPTIKGEFA